MVKVNMVDVMGTLFTAPVLVPYGQQLGATTGEIASFSTVPRSSLNMDNSSFETIQFF